MARGKALLECLLDSSVSKSVICTYELYTFVSMQCIDMHTHVYRHTHTLLPALFLLCNKDISFLCLCAPGRSNPSERSWCCYTLNTGIFCWCQGSRELFPNCLSSADLSAGYLPWKLCCSNFTIQLFTHNCCYQTGELWRTIRISIKAHALKFSWFCKLSWEILYD